MSWITIGNSETSMSIDGGGLVIFNNVISFEVNNPRTRKLIDSPQGGGDGLFFEENLTQSIALSTVLRDVPADVYKDIVGAWNKKQRIDLSIIDLMTGRTMTGKNMILSDDPSNGKADGSEDTLDLTLKFQVTSRNFTNTIKDL